MTVATYKELLIDADEVGRALRAILSPCQVTELRVLDAVTKDDRRPHTFGGYFDDADKLIEALGRVVSAKGIYITPNPVKQALLARSMNKGRAVGRDPLTGDADILRRTYLLIDCDAVRPAGIAASEEEHDAALAKVTEIDAALADEGWSSPIIADSGNGGHLLYRIDQPCNATTVAQEQIDANQRKQATTQPA